VGDSKSPIDEQSYKQLSYCFMDCGAVWRSRIHEMIGEQREDHLIACV
jgi:hypothetical protein